MFLWKHVNKYHSPNAKKFLKNIVKIFLLRNVNKVQKRFVGMFQERFVLMSRKRYVTFTQERNVLQFPKQLATRLGSQSAVNIALTPCGVKCVALPIRTSTSHCKYISKIKFVLNFIKKASSCHQISAITCALNKNSPLIECCGRNSDSRSS